MSGRDSLLPAVARAAALLLLFTALTAVMTYPQILRLTDGVGEHLDPFFSIWRLSWVAHALREAPGQLFNGNIFYPEQGTLAYSDAMPLEAAIALPFLWLGANQVLVYNLLFLAGFAFSGAAMAVLVRSLTGRLGPAIFAGIVFAFVPYRFDHYIHLELQWAMWAPLAFWAAHRCVASGRLRDGILTGVFTALQILSSIYYGIFLISALAVFVPLLLLARHLEHRRSVAISLLIGGALAAAVLFVYSRPYMANEERLGHRDRSQVALYSATPEDYLATSLSNVVYGRVPPFRFQIPERTLYQGALALLLAVVALWPPWSAVRVAYAALALLTFEGSLGTNGFLYPLLYDHILPYRGLRAPARLGIFVTLCIAVLAGFGLQRVTASIAGRARGAVCAALCALALIEYAAIPLALQRVPPIPRNVYSYLEQLPGSPIVEFPLAAPHELGNTSDGFFMYFSTIYWRPMLNGYSGFHPPSYVELLEHMRSFPDEPSLTYLRRRGARYVLLHREFYDEHTYEKVLNGLIDQRGIPLVGIVGSGRREVRIYRLEQG